MKRIFFLIGLVFCGVMQPATALVQKEMCHAGRNVAGAERKFSVSLLLHGLANTCNQLGNAVGAENEKEKQQAALGIVGALLSLAGNITAKDDATINQDHIKKTIGLIGFLVEDMRFHDEACLKGMSFPLFQAITLLKDPAQRESLIAEKLASRETAPVIFQEISIILHNFIIKNSSFFVELLQKILLKASQEVHVCREVQKNGEQQGVSEQSVIMVNLLCDFMVDILDQKSVRAYVKNQLIVLADYVCEQLHGNAVGLKEDAPLLSESF